MSDLDIETFEHNGKTITIALDTEPELFNPRDADELGIMLANGHRQYTLGDEQFKGSFLARMKTGEYEQAEAALTHYAEQGKIHLFPRWCRIYLGSTCVLPLGLIDHSGISMYVGAGASPFDPGGWDSGLVGFIFDTAKTREQIGTPIERIEEALEAEVEIYDQYLTGQVYSYSIEDEDGDLVGSCGGFLGSMDYVRQSARDEAGYTCKHCNQEIARNVGPLYDEPDESVPEPPGGRFVHSCCATCGRDVDWGGDGWFHSGMKPWDWPTGKPDHVATISHRYACEDGQHQAETDQAVGSYE